MCILWSLWAGPTNEWPDVAPPVGKKKNFLRKNYNFFQSEANATKIWSRHISVNFLRFLFQPFFSFSSFSIFPSRQTFNKGFAVTERRPPLRPNSFHWKKSFKNCYKNVFFSLPAKENWRWEKLVMFWYAELWAILRGLGSGTVAERLWAPAKLTLFVNSRRM